MSANAGALIASVIYLKKGENKRFVIVDAAMNDLVRPTLYDAYHDILPVNAPRAGRRASGREATSSARSARAAIIWRSTATCPNSRAGDLIAVMSAGAYGAVQAGTYNSRLLVPEVLVRGAEYAVVRPRRTFEELIALDTLPPWLK